MASLKAISATSLITAVLACAAAQARPAGYTLLGASDTLMLNGVFKRATYDVRKTFVPIVQLTT